MDVTKQQPNSSGKKLSKKFHLSALILPPAGAGDRAKDFQDDLDQIPGAVARFLRREAPPPSGGAALRVAGAFALKARLCRMSW